jgi:hypothetical protein
LHPNPKEVGDYFLTREFFPVGVLKLMDVGHQGFSGHFIFGSGLCVLGSAPLNFISRLKWRNAIFVGEGRLILYVHLFLAPTLDRVGEFYVEVINIEMDTYTNATYMECTYVRRW